MDSTMTRSSTAARPARTLESLATAAVVGQVVLLASALLLPLVSEYGLVGDTISELALGRFGWVQTVAFAVAGLGTLALAWVLRRLTAGAWGSRVGSLLVGVYGVGSLLVAVFPTERVDGPMGTAGTIHVAASLVAFVAMIVGMYVLFRTFLLLPRWRSLTPWIVLLPASALPLFLGQSDGPWVGLLQRLLVGAIAIWIIVVAVKARAIAASAVAGRAG